MSCSRSGTTCVRKSPAYRPEIVVKTRNVPGKDKCVMPVEYMRDLPHEPCSRTGVKPLSAPATGTLPAPTADEFQRSLSGTCLDCHSNKRLSATDATIMLPCSRIAGIVTWRRPRRFDEGYRQKEIPEIGCGCRVARRAHHWACWPRLPLPRRWAMVVDLKKCREKNDCTLCISACHKAHNVPDFGNSKDEVKWIWKDSFESAFPEQDHEFQADTARHAGRCSSSATTAIIPPVSAYARHRATWKRESDGLVMMDWHRCIGCRYCMAACPYGSRSFNWRDPAAVHQGDYHRVSDANARRGRKVQLLRRAARGGRNACLRQGLSCRRADLWRHARPRILRSDRCCRENYTIRRRSGLGTQPQVYYIV